MLFPDILCERLVPDYVMVLEIVCVSCYVSMRFMQPIVSCIQSGARKRRRRPASAAELAPHIFVAAARSSSDELSYGGRLVSCPVSSCLIVASSHSCRPTPTLLSPSHSRSLTNDDTDIPPDDSHNTSIVSRRIAFQPNLRVFIPPTPFSRPIQTLQSFACFASPSYGIINTP
jgi:hypothetical protein